MYSCSSYIITVIKPQEEVYWLQSDLERPEVAKVAVRVLSNTVPVTAAVIL